LDNGIEVSVAKELENLTQLGLLGESDVDERAVEAIKEFPPQRALEVLAEFRESNLEHVTNKSAFLCSIMKVNRQKMKTTADHRPGPDDLKIKAILERTGYSLDVTTGQRKYGGPPPKWDGPTPGAGHEVFCGHIPKDIFEDVLIPLFEKCGTIWDLRLMMDPLTGFNRSFCFVTFTDKEGANEAVRQLNGYNILPGKALKVNISVANVRLFVGNIPKNKSKEEILEEFSKHTDGLTDVIIYNSPDDVKKKNRGFAFLEYDSHKSASMAKHRIGNGYTRVWGCDIIVDWADPLEEPDDETMSKVKVLYVRNLKSDVTEDQLREKFEQFGKVERVKKVKDYGFIHFEDRDNALTAMSELNGQKVGESEMQISLAKPPAENKQKEKRKQMQKMQFFRGYDDSWLPPYHSGLFPPPRGPGRFFRPPGPHRGAAYHRPYYGGDYDNYSSYVDYDYGGHSDPPYVYYPPAPTGYPRSRGAASQPRPAAGGGGWQVTWRGQGAAAGQPQAPTQQWASGAAGR
jgi:RNA recognition motif-containing protein